jgi:uncharacterized protein with HEPN domain
VSKTDASYAEGALEHVETLRAHLVAESPSRQMKFDAVCMRLAAALEDASHITPETRDSAFGDRWHAMWAMRNRIAHGYLAIDPRAVTATLGPDLDAFESALRSIARRAPR